MCPGLGRKPQPTFLSEKSRQKNFAPTTPLYFGEAFEFPKDFSRKVLCVRVPRRTAPTYNAHKKHGIAVLFLLFFVMSWNCVPNLALRGFFEKSSLKIRKNFPHRRATSLWQKNFSYANTPCRYARHTLFMPDSFKNFYSFSCFFKKVLVFSLLFRYNQYVSGELW